MIFSASIALRARSTAACLLAESFDANVGQNPDPPRMLGIRSPSFAARVISFSALARGSAAVGSVASSPKVGSTPLKPAAAMCESTSCPSGASVSSNENARFMAGDNRSLSIARRTK
jgi:hypothetical protein